MTKKLLTVDDSPSVRKLVEFALNIPDKIKFKKKTTKYILKKACEGIIPNEIIYRKKMGFGAPIVRWFNQEGHFAKRFEKSKLVTETKSRNPYTIAVQKWVLQNYEAIKEL